MPSSEAHDSTLEALLSSEILAFLNSGRVPKRRIEFRKKQTLFSQGEPAKNIFYIQAGSIRVAVTSTTGKEGVVAILGPGDVFGEGCLEKQSLRKSTATAIQLSTISCVKRGALVRLIRVPP